MARPRGTALSDDVSAQWRALVTHHAHHRHGPGSDSIWAPELECASKDEIESLQSAKLRLAVRYMYERSKLFRTKCAAIGLEPGDVAGLRDLTHIPITTKDDMSRDLVENPPWGTYTAIDDELWLNHGWQIFQTSGTTSAPRPFRYTAFDRDIWAWTDARALYAMGLRSGKDSVMLCFGYGPHVAMWGLHYALHLMNVPVVTGGGLDSRTRAMMIDRYRPTTIACTPSYALHLAGVMGQLGLPAPESSVARLICMGEAIPRSSRERIQMAWASEVHQFYGCTEAAPSCAGYTCSYGVHFMEDTHLVETVDPDTLQPVGPGEPGITVVTNLCSEASPQLRFLVGDFATLVPGECECGRTHLRAQNGFEGRADDMLNIRGVTLFPAAVEDFVRGFKNLDHEFQIVITRSGELDELTLIVEAVPELPESRFSELTGSVAGTFRALFEIRATVEVRRSGTLPRTEFKARRVIDMR